MEKGFVYRIPKFPVESQLVALRARGLTDRAIYNGHREGQDIPTVVASFRGQGGTLYIHGDGRVLARGSLNWDAIEEAYSACERAGIKVVDLAHQAMDTHPAQQKLAYAQLAIRRGTRNIRKRAKIRGALGGKQRSINEKQKREALDAVARRGMERQGEILSLRVLSYVLGKGFSVSVLLRHYSKKRKR